MWAHDALKVNGLALQVGTTCFILCIHSASQGQVAARAVLCTSSQEVVQKEDFHRAFSKTLFHKVEHGFDRAFSLQLFSGSINKFL